MNRKISILVMMLLITSSTITLAHWDPEDGHKMHYAQLPDPNGWDVYATAGLDDFPQIVLADDWECSETGWIKDIHFWGSWYNDLEGIIDHFVMGVAENIPAGTGGIAYSRPGETLHEWTIYDWEVRGPLYGDQGFYFPYIPEALWHDHEIYYQYNIFLNEADWFWQEEGVIYWLFISAIVEFDPTGAQPLWGWKSSNNHWEDDACWAEWDILDWVDLWEPEPELVVQNGFGVTVMQNFVETFWAENYYGEGFYYYPDTNWWNIWFYDHPFDEDRYKEIHVEFIFIPLDPGFSWANVVVNWATDAWQPGDPPPLPPNDQPFIGRSPVDMEYTQEGFYFFDFVIPDYNPEWVSIDVRGEMFILDNGLIVHECKPDASPQSLDLAFVITGEPELPCVDVEKKVSTDGGVTWSDEVDALVGDTVEFKITVHNCGYPDLTNIKITDTLPDCLEYITNSATVDGVADEPVIVGGNKLVWTIPGPLSFCNTIEILFEAEVVSTGENINNVLVTADSPTGSVSETDSAIVNGLEEPKIPDLDCDGQLTWTDVDPGSNVTTTISVSNIGDPGSKLDWSVCSYPTGWSNWTFVPSSGLDLTPAASPQSITVTIEVPNEKSETFTGEVKLCNDEDSTDTCEIQVSLTTPKIKTYDFGFLFLRLFEKYKLLFPTVWHIIYNLYLG